MQWAERICGKSWSNTESSNYRWMMSEEGEGSGC